RIMGNTEEAHRFLDFFSSTGSESQAHTNWWLYETPQSIGPDGQLQPARIQMTGPDGQPVFPDDQVRSIAQIAHMVGGDTDTLGDVALALAALEHNQLRGKTPHPDMDLMDA